ncbi:3-ketoacyl-ACP reductase [Algimonas arctica]|uniref:3-ketoacyl-ACP reductase n=1 Tax=Algimonas arctica TaxID=1479486 RepID=A0A8J3G3F6_9PROT|nr:SDR family oxidoreductase [Algimonas arctica]GHB04027.1 3-ketoacyl-ACP reductase [Algimonas arctica]
MATYLVTGGNRGIGAATVKAIRALNPDARILIASRTAPELSHNVEWIEADLATQVGLSAVKEHLPDCDGLINNAGIMIGKGAFDITEQERDMTRAINQIAVVELSLALIKAAAGKPVRIVNNSSIAAHLGHPDIWYGMTKAAVLNFTKSVAKSFGPQGVVCNCVAAGPVETDMLNKIPDGRQQALKSAAILGRFAKPSDVADVMAWLAIDSPDYVNGVCIDINNGTYMR